MSLQKEQIEESDGSSVTSMPENDSSTKDNEMNRRISQIPIRRPSSLSISGVLKGMLGYQQNEEDLEFLKHMWTQKKAIKLKAESLQLCKELSAVNQERELLVSKWEKIQKEVLEMQISYDRTVQLGRAFLCRQDVVSAKSLPAHAVLMQLKPSMVQQVREQQLAKLQTLKKELKQYKIHDTVQSVKQTENLSMKMDSYKQQIEEANCQLQEAQKEVATLKCEAEKLKEALTIATECLYTTREKIQHLLSSKEDGAASLPITDEEKQRMDRRLKRILRRKDIFLEREKLLQSFIELG
ncbi:kinesin-like protein KIF20A isoform X1 [Microcaecilia unicolor]|uniref:Kinesin-like protein KIF20A isoform X1 n=2 Tax=Microcaecilia unicolor TaxID=1415580 RepID=A0A6P7YD40_9AMPH|nr:kinesin-like protein KIF20A isoform X1 [Microcaecilia unicolor]